MTIVFDLRALQIGHENRGIGMFIRSLLEHLPADDNEYIFYAFDRSNPIEELGIKFDNTYRLVQTPTIKTSLNAPSDIFGLLKLIRHSFQRLRPFKPDVFVQFDFGLGLPNWPKTKKIVMAYDLIPLIKKNEYLPSARFAWQHSRGKKSKLRAVARSLYYQLKYKLHYRVYKQADSILSISEATAKSFVDLLNISQQKIHAIPLAPVLAKTAQDDSLAKKITKPYVFYIGGTDSRKRVEDIVYAFDIAKSRGFDCALVLAGNEFKVLEDVPTVEGRNAIMRSSYKSDIHLVGFVSDAQKLALYATAHAFLFCSTYEGFGLPVVEAMSAGCPVISYNNSSIPEAAGAAAHLVDTGDYVAVAHQILALQDHTLREQTIKRGHKQAQKFDWDNYVTQFMKLLTA